MDNSPTHDEATLRTDVWTLDCADVGLNSLLALDGEMLANMARALGQRVRSRAVRDRARNPLRPASASDCGTASAASSPTGCGPASSRASLAPTSFYPLIAGAASEEQARALLPLLDGRHQVRRHLAAALLHARRSGLPRQRLLARPRLAAAQLPGLARPQALRLRRRSDRSRRQQLPPVPGRMGAPQLPRELQRRHRRSPRPARHRLVLRLGRAHAHHGRRRSHRRQSLERLGDHPRCRRQRR